MGKQPKRLRALTKTEIENTYAHTHTHIYILADKNAKYMDIIRNMTNQPGTLLDEVTDMQRSSG